MLSLTKRYMCVLLSILIIFVFVISGCSEKNKGVPEFDEINTFSYVHNYGSYAKQGDWLLYSKSDSLMIYSLETGESYTLLKDKFNLLESGYGYKTIVGNKIYYITSSWMNTPGNMYQYDIDTGEKVKIPGIDATIYTYMAIEDYLYIILRDSTIYKTSELYRYNVATRKLEFIAEGNYCYACFSEDNMYFYDSIADSICKMSLSNFNVDILYNNKGKYEVGFIVPSDSYLYFQDKYNIIKYNMLSNDVSVTYESDNNNGDISFWIYKNYMIYDRNDYVDDFSEVKVVNLLTNEEKTLVKSYDDYLDVDVFEDVIIVDSEGKTNVYSLSGALLATLPR